MNPTRFGSQSALAVDGLPMLLVSLMNLSFLLALMLVAGLREMPTFWTNAGGWPLWARAGPAV